MIDRLIYDTVVSLRHRVEALEAYVQGRAPSTEPAKGHSEDENAAQSSDKPEKNVNGGSIEGRPMVDWTKPIMRFGDLRPARVVATDLTGEYPIVVAFMMNDGSEWPKPYRQHGGAYTERSKTPSFDDIVNVTRMVKRELVVYAPRDGIDKMQSFLSDHAPRVPHGKIPPGRIEVRMTWEEPE